MYHAQESLSSRNTCHHHKVTSLVSPLYLFVGDAFKILMESIDVEVVRGRLGGGDK
jgi:hypothetical protein